MLTIRTVFADWGPFNNYDNIGTVSRKSIQIVKSQPAISKYKLAKQTHSYQFHHFLRVTKAFFRPQSHQTSGDYREIQKRRAAEEVLNLHDRINSFRCSPFLYSSVVTWWDWGRKSFCEKWKIGIKVNVSALRACTKCKPGSRKMVFYGSLM